MKSLSQLEQCVDLTTLDAQFQRACCGQSDYIRLNNGFGSSSGYDWIDTACTASTYNVSNTRSLIVVFAYFIYRLSLFTQSPILHLCLFLYYWAHLITLIKHYTTLHYMQCPMQPSATSSLTTSPYLPPGYYASHAACIPDNLLYTDASTGKKILSLCSCHYLWYYFGIVYS